MLIFDKLQGLNIKNPNALTGLVINLVYFLLILPTCFNFLLHENALFFRYWFFILLVIYTLVYAKLYKSKKK